MSWLHTGPSVQDGRVSWRSSVCHYVFYRRAEESVLITLREDPR